MTQTATRLPTAPEMTLEEQLAEAIKALRSYANRSNYERELLDEFTEDIDSSWIEQDGGTKARRTLRKLGVGQ